MGQNRKRHRYSQYAKPKPEPRQNPGRWTTLMTTIGARLACIWVEWLFRQDHWKPWL